MKNNQHYFKISQSNPEPPLDNFYIFDKKHPEIAKYVKKTKEIKNYLITIKILLDKKENNVIINKYFELLRESLSNFSNCSEFSCFINACDNVLDYVKNDLNLLKKITKRYFKNRTLNENVPEEWIQAILDSNSGRKKGSCGENKLLDILKKKGFKKIESWDDFEKSNKCVTKFSKKFNLKIVRKKLKIKIKTTKQNKRLDLLIKDGKRMYLLEAKHLNTAGGGQDKQISELIEILSLKEKRENIFYISFLDGNYSNVLLGKGMTGDKVKKQRKEINKFLKRNKNNFWVNTKGFIELFN